MLQSAASAAPNRLRAEQTSGTLEVLLLTPAPSWLITLGLSVYDTCRGLVAAVLTLLLGVTLAGAAITVAPWPLALGLLGLVVLSLALGTALAALVLVFKQATALAAAGVSALALLSGAHFPASALPPGLSDVARALPTTWVLDLLRAGLVDGSFSASQAVGVVLCLVLAPLAAAGLLRLALARAVATGTVGLY